MSGPSAVLAYPVRRLGCRERRISNLRRWYDRNLLRNVVETASRRYAGVVHEDVDRAKVFLND